MHAKLRQPSMRTAETTTDAQRSLAWLPCRGGKPKPSGLGTNATASQPQGEATKPPPHHAGADAVVRVVTARCRVRAGAMNAFDIIKADVRVGLIWVYAASADVASGLHDQRWRGEVGLGVTGPEL